jgi:hypothetical protein
VGKNPILARSWPHVKTSDKWPVTSGEQNPALAGLSDGHSSLITHHSSLHLGERLQFLAGLEAHSFSGGDTDFCSRSGVPPDTGLARFHIENTEATQFNAVSLRQGFLHGIKHSFNGHLSFCLRNACAIDDLIDDVQLYHANLLKIQALILRSQRGIVKNILLDYDFPLFSCRMVTIP